MADTERSPRVEACIQNAMEKYAGGSPKRDLTYYQNVHQDLAPLARELENALLIANARIAQMEHALASRPAEVDDKIPRESNDALIALAKYWKLDGDWMTCKGCRRSLIASRDGEELAHGDGCKYWDQQHPWAQLRKLIARRPAPSHTTNKENGGPDGSVLDR